MKYATRVVHFFLRGRPQATTLRSWYVDVCSRLLCPLPSVVIPNQALGPQLASAWLTIFLYHQVWVDNKNGSLLVT